MPEEPTASVAPQTGAEPGHQAGGVASAGAVADSTTATPKSTIETIEERRFTQADLDKHVNARLAEERAKRQKQAEAEKLAQAGEYQKLADQYRAQADGAQAELEATRQQLAAYEAMLSASYEARLKALPKDARRAVEGIPGLSVAQRLAWLEENAALFVRTPPPDINTGATQSGPQAGEMTEQDRQRLASKYNINPKYIGS